MTTERQKSGARSSQLLPFTFSIASFRRYVLPLALLCAAFALQSLAGVEPKIIERYYSRALYLHLAHALAYVNKFFNFSIAELLIVALIVVFVVWIIWSARRIYLRHVKWRAFLSVALARALWVAACGALLFLCVWGFNYQRPPLIESLQLEQRRAGAFELEAIAREIISGINRNYEAAQARVVISGDKTNAVRSSQLPLDKARLYDILESAYQQETLLGEARGSGFGSPKPVYFSRVMSRLGLAGTYTPFTGEPNYNAEQPDCDAPFSIAHEKAHQRGYARESEANFIAFLTCIHSSDPYVRYSGYLNALRIVSELARVAPDRARDVYRELGTGARNDLNARYYFWSGY